MRYEVSYRDMVASLAWIRGTETIRYAWPPAWRSVKISQAARTKDGVRAEREPQGEDSTRPLGSAVVRA